MEVIIKLSELQKALQVSSTTVRNYLRRGLPHTRGKHPNSQILLDLDEALRWLEANVRTKKPSSEFQRAQLLEYRARAEQEWANWIALDLEPEVELSQIEAKALEKRVIYLLEYLRVVESHGGLEGLRALGRRRALTRQLGALNQIHLLD